MSDYRYIDHEFAYALIYDDRTGLSDEDERLLDAWLKGKTGHIILATENESDSDEGTCEVTNLYTDSLTKVEIRQ